MDEKIETINGSGAMNSGRKRGHQHHIRNMGTRRSNVPADEVIAALRSDCDHLPVTPNRCATNEDDHKNRNRHRHRRPNRDSTYSSDTESNLAAVDTANNNNLMNRNLFSDNNNDKVVNRSNNDGSGEAIEISSNKNDHNNASMDKGMLIMINENNNNRFDSMASTKRLSTALIDSTNDRVRAARMDGISNATISDLIESSKHSMSTSQLSASTSSDFDMDAGAKDDLDDSISSSSSSSNLNKSKSKKSRKPDMNHRSERKREKRTKIMAAPPPNGERPPLEGSDERRFESDEMADIENDPEAAEWSKLRCTSERTEVVAEREYRRQNRRCADYPGLAFGRSIFSSDTMMKLNIIRNELHNIMKTQLKRVRVRFMVVCKWVTEIENYGTKRSQGLTLIR